VQVAKAFAAEVTATTTSGKQELVGSVGADEVIDYTRDDFRDRGTRYDVIFDVGGELSLRMSARVKAERTADLCGCRLRLRGPIGRFIGSSFRAKVFRQPVVAFVSWESTDDLMTLKELIEAGKVAPTIGRTYALAETPDAVADVESGAACGKVVVTV
jgi:NADPH:quinone reductase-like Zn-dependent oxidoreductase